MKFVKILLLLSIIIGITIEKRFNLQNSEKNKESRFLAKQKHAHSKKRHKKN